MLSGAPTLEAPHQAPLQLSSLSRFHFSVSVCARVVLFFSTALLKRQFLIPLISCYPSSFQSFFYQSQSFWTHSSPIFSSDISFVKGVTEYKSISLKIEFSRGVAPIFSSSSYHKPFRNLARLPFLPWVCTGVVPHALYSDALLLDLISQSPAFFLTNPRVSSYTIF